MAALGSRRAKGTATPLKLAGLVAQNRTCSTVADLPQEYLDEYGFAVLERTIFIDFPAPPSLDFEGVIAKLPDPLTLNTIDAVVNAVRPLSSSLEQLFGLFYVTVKTFEFDIDAARSGGSIDLSPDVLFKSKQTVSEGFVAFLMELGTRAGLKQPLGMKEYPCFAKFLSYDPISANLDQLRPSGPNHVALFIEVDGRGFLCEPTRACLTGNLRANFLLPLDRVAHTYFREDNPHGLTFPHFLKQMIFCEDENDFDCRHESCSADRCRVKHGIKKSYFSCSSRVARVSAQLDFFSGNSWQRQSRYLVGCRFIGPVVNDRRRFVLGISFPRPGQYRCSVYLDGMAAVTLHPYAVVGSPKLLGIQEMDDRFNAEILAPNELLTDSEDGQFLVWLRLHGYFAESRVRTCRVDETFEPIAQEKDITNRSLVSLTEISGDAERVDMKIAISFPFAGLQHVIISLPDDETDGFKDALDLFVNVARAHRGDIDTPEALLARAAPRSE
jgi:hypothetical protein